MNFFNKILRKESFIKKEADEAKSKRNNQLLNGFNSSKDNVKRIQKNTQIESKQYESKNTNKKDE